MASKEEARQGAEARFKIAKEKAASGHAAMADYAAAAASVTSKIERLRALRLAKEAADREAAPPPAAPRVRKPTARPDASGKLVMKAAKPVKAAKPA